MTTWETIEAPSGSFIGWGTRKGQFVEGLVTEYSDDGGTDFGGGRCPQISIELTEKAASFNKAGDRTDHDPGHQVQITAGQVKLKAVLVKAAPKVGDRIRIELADVIKTANGNTLKDFKVGIARGDGSTNGKSSGPSAAAGLVDIDTDDEPPF